MRRLPVGEAVLDAILNLVRSARPGTPEALPEITRSVIWGPGGCWGISVSVITMMPVAATPRFSPAVDAAAARSQVNGL